MKRSSFSPLSAVARPSAMLSMLESALNGRRRAARSPHRRYVKLAVESLEARMALDAALGIQLEKIGGLEVTSRTIGEGRTAVALVRLSTPPVENQVVRVSRAAGDRSISVLAHARLTFTPTNWDKFQWVLFGASEDSDQNDGVAVFRLTSNGLPSKQIRLTERDNDVPARRITRVVLVDDFVAQPLPDEVQAGREFSFYNRLQGNRGEILSSDGATVSWGVGSVTARLLQNGQFAGVFQSLNQINSEGRSLNLNAMLPEQISAPFQQRATTVVINVADGMGSFTVEIKSPSNELLWSATVQLTGGLRTLRLALPNPAPVNAQVLNWTIQGPAGSFAQVTRTALLTSGRDRGRLETFVWPYAALLRNYDPQTGLTRDRANFPSGEFDNTSASGLQALTAVVAADLGVIRDAQARAIVEKSTTILLSLPRLHGLLPHFTVGKDNPSIKPGTEYSSLDTVLAWLGVLLARQRLGLPTDAVEQAFRDIDWADLRLPNGTISHGYTEQGERLTNGWDTFGGETFLAVLAHAMSRPNESLAAVPYPNPPTANGSGFIDELAWLLVPPPATDVWGNAWASYRAATARAQALDAVFAQAPGPIFGLSAGEVPAPWQVPSGAVYQAFGTGGRWAQRNDGTQFFGVPVALPHYAGMIAAFEPNAAYAMWDFLEQYRLVSPLNAVESLFLDQGDSIQPTWNSLKGSLNLAFTALGYAKPLQGANYSPYLAASANPFVLSGLDRLRA